MAVTAAIATAAIALGGTAYQVNESEIAKDDSEAAAKKQADNQAAAVKEQTELEEAERRKAAGLQQRAMGRQGAGNRAGTVLTSPLGVVSPTSATGGKGSIGA